MDAPAPIIQMVVTNTGTPVWEVSGHGITTRHRQAHQALLIWHCQAVAVGYEGPAPILEPLPFSVEP
jgi:hypothetical protein